MKSTKVSTALLSLALLAAIAALFTCEKVPEYCGNGVVYNPDCDFCYGSKAYRMCSNEKGQYNPLVQGCTPTTDVIGTRCSDGSVVPIGTPCGGYMLTTAVTPEGVGRIERTPDGQTNFAAGEDIILNAITANDGYEFVEWTGTHTSKDRGTKYTMNGAKQQVTIVAMFKPKGEDGEYTLITTEYPEEGGIITRSRQPNPRTGKYNNGEAVTVTAVANHGYVFDGWSGSVSGASAKEPTLSLTMNETKTLISMFIPTAHKLSVNVNPSDAGAVFINGTALSDGRSLDVGTTIVVLAKEAEGYRFTGWTGSASFDDKANPYTKATLGTDAAITANFQRGSGGGGTVTAPTAVMCTLTVNIVTDDNGDGGSVSRSPDVQSYPVGTTVTLTAIANGGYSFAGWSGESNTSNPKMTLIMNGNMTLTANFRRGSGGTDATTTARFFIRSGTPVINPPVTAYKDAAAAGTARMYAVPNDSVELIAGTRMPIVGQLFSSANIGSNTWLSNTQNGKWTWAIVPGSPSITKEGEGISTNPTLMGGDSITFMTTVANNTYKIRGTYKDAAAGITTTHDIWISVIPDVVNPVLVIEPNNKGLTLSPNAPQRVGELAFTESDLQKTVYAVIRDKYGNYICPSGAPNPYPPPTGNGTTNWTTSKNIVTLESGNALSGEEKINNGGLANGGEDVVTAKNSAWGNVSDSVKVRWTATNSNNTADIKNYLTVDAVSYSLATGKITVTISGLNTLRNYIGKITGAGVESVYLLYKPSAAAVSVSDTTSNGGRVQIPLTSIPASDNTMEFSFTVPTSKNIVDELYTISAATYWLLNGVTYTGTGSPSLTSTNKTVYLLDPKKAVKNGLTLSVTATGVTTTANGISLTLAVSGQDATSLNPGVTYKPSVDSVGIWYKRNGAQPSLSGNKLVKETFDSVMVFSFAALRNKSTVTFSTGKLVNSGSDTLHFAIAPRWKGAGITDTVARPLSFILAIATANSTPPDDSYESVVIGTQTWMKKNLNIETEGSWCFYNDADSCAKYGRLYNWEAAMKACPTGWHLPSNVEWTVLVNYAGGTSTAGKALKSTSSWGDGYNGTDTHGFSALPGGNRYSGGLFGDVGRNGYWWSSTEYDGSYAYSLYMQYDYDFADENNIKDKSNGISVRCILNGGHPPTYTVTFNPNGGTVTPMTDVTDTSGKLKTLPTPTRDGYTFNGWFTASTGGTVITLDKAYIANTTIYAHWTVVTTPTTPSDTGRFTYGDQSYKTVKIGSQTWMAENLNIETADSWCYKDSAKYCAEYGRLYSWSAAKTACPVGWHLPSNEEWKILVDLAGGKSAAGKALKSTSGWGDGYNGTDTHGFSALPGGARYSYGSFVSAGSSGGWWTATEDGSGAYKRGMYSGYTYVDEDVYNKSGDGFSVRCVEDD